MQVYFHVYQSHFHKNGFAVRLALEQRHKGTRKWPIRTRSACVLFQDLQNQVTAGEEELGQVKRQAEETEGILRQTVEQLNEVSLLNSLHVNPS